MQRVVPAIRVTSYETSKSFYAKLGFEEQWTHQFEPGFPVFASIAREELQVFLTEHTGDCEFGSIVHFFVPNVDACYAEFQGNGISVYEPPNNDLSPNLRQMAIIDPDRNRLKFLTRKG
jgi:catechol 2,3-dioxygenase-like lactoylglutathione lyase family enzyme